MFKIDNLSKNFKGFYLNDISLEAGSNKIVGILGKNGAGKTTLLRTVAGLYYQETKNITIDDIQYHNYDTEYRKKVFFMPEANIIPDHFNSKTFAALLKAFYPLWQDDTFQAVLLRLHVPEGKNMKSLSLGNKRKLHISAAFAANTDVVLLDEPTANIDPVDRETIQELIIDYSHNKNKTVLYSSHTISEVLEAADYIMVINDGSRVFCEENDGSINSKSLLEMMK
jgi:ABC-2 type transport system ATP-binding protein